MAQLKCPQCDRTFAKAMHLGRHMTASHGKAPKKAAKPAAAPGAMPVSGGAAAQLGALIERLQKQRQEHVQAIAEIDNTFARFGITPAGRKRRGRPRRS